MSIQIVQQIIGELESFQEQNGSTLSHLETSAHKIMEACGKIERSWSGSFAGWHGKMYFADFAKPELHERFSGEWGGLNGIPDDWIEREADEVEAAIDNLIEGGRFSVKNFASGLERSRGLLEDFQSDVVILVNLLDENEFSKEASFIEAIRGFRFETLRAEYVNSRLPSRMMSRDSEAIGQGMTIPVWLYYAAVGHDAVKLTGRFQDFRKLIERMGKQAAARIAHTSKHHLAPALIGIHKDIVEKCSTLYKAGAYAEAVEKSFKVVRDRLRALTGYEKGAEAFGKGKLRIDGAAASHVEEDFNSATKFLTMAIDMFRNEKSHTSDARIDDPVRAYQYLALSSLALSLLQGARIRT